MHEIRNLEPEPRRKLRQLCFWVLLVCLEVSYFELAWLPLAAGAAVAGVLVLARRGTRPSFVILHGAILGGLALAYVATGDWLLIADFAMLGALVVLELLHPRTSLLLLIAVEHGVMLTVSHWTPLTLVRFFAVIMVLAIVVRLRIAPRFAEEEQIVAPPPPPTPRKPMTVAEWEAQNPPDGSRSSPPVVGC